MKLLSKFNTKIEKSNSSKKGYITRILNLAPAKLSNYNTCKFSSCGCRKGCLNTAGLSVFSTVQKSRINKTNLWFNDRELFKKLLIKELHNFTKYCQLKKQKPAIRLNGTSDISWEVEWPELFSEFAHITFYDYSKNPHRILRSKLPPNYYLLFSRSESNEKWVDRIIRETNKNVAVVFKNKLPKKWKGRTVICGDSHDLRFLDRPNSIVGLTAKGKARHDISGFVVV